MRENGGSFTQHNHFEDIKDIIDIINIYYIDTEYVMFI